MTVRSLTPAPRGFHGDTFLLRLVELLAKDATVFLETGSNVGSTLGDVARRYPHLACLSCEPDPAAHDAAQRYATIRSDVQVYQETSQEFMERIRIGGQALYVEPILAWLDAHDYGFEWPLREEIAFLTENFERGAILIDDFQVPGRPEFGWDQYDGHLCSFPYIQGSISEKVAYRLSYPTYSEHTSPWHPLRGWGLLQFAPTLEEIPKPSEVLPDVCQEAAAREGWLAPDPPGTAAKDEVDGLITQLRQRLAAAPHHATHLNDLGVCLAVKGDHAGALGALSKALNLEPDHPDAVPNYRDVARASAKQGGLPIPVAPGRSGRMVARDPYVDLGHLVETERPLIVDGGANRGDTVARLREQFPHGAMHAFEPIPALASGIRRRYPTDAHLTVHAAALSSEEGPLRFEVCDRDVMSSMLPASATTQRYQGAGAAISHTVDTLKRRLDRAFAETIDVLKLDIQGHELEALRGAGRLLADIQVVLTEVEFTPLYDGQPLFADIDAFMRSQGFRLFNLYDLWCHPDGQITAGDAIYVNGRYFG